MMGFMLHLHDVGGTVRRFVMREQQEDQLLEIEGRGSSIIPRFTFACQVVRRLVCLLAFSVVAIAEIQHK